jgi:hypothetical protein
MVAAMIAAYGGDHGILAMSYDPAEDMPALQSEWNLLKKHCLFGSASPGFGTHSTTHHGEPWYVGSMDRETCKAAVTSGGPGDYLIRNSSDGRKMVVVVAGRSPGEVACYQVVPGPDSMYLVSGVPYKHVAEVLSSMRTNHPNGNDGKPLPLANIAKYV